MSTILSYLQMIGLKWIALLTAVCYVVFAGVMTLRFALGTGQGVEQVVHVDPPYRKGKHSRNRLQLLERNFIRQYECGDRKIRDGCPNMG